jgi:DNA polymerase-3 subunit chi
VTGPPELLDALDRQLWTFEDTEFLPHLRLVKGAEPAPRLRPTERTPIPATDTPKH